MGRRIISDADYEQLIAASTTLSNTPPAQSGLMPGIQSTPKDKEIKNVPVLSGQGEIKADDYKMKLLKYVPAEIVTAYVALEGIIKTSAQASSGAYWVIFGILLMLTPIYIWRATTEKNKKPAWDQIIVSFFAFFIWVLALGGPFTTLSWYQPLYPALALPIFTLVIPLIRVNHK